MKLQKEGITKVDRELYKDLLGCINKAQQELNNLKFSNKMRKGRIDRLRDRYQNGKSSGKKINSNEENIQEKFGEDLYKKEKFPQKDQEMYLLLFCLMIL